MNKIIEKIKAWLVGMVWKGIEPMVEDVLENTDTILSEGAVERIVEDRIDDRLGNDLVSTNEVDNKIEDAIRDNDLVNCDDAKDIAQEVVDDNIIDEDGIRDIAQEVVGEKVEEEVKKIMGMDNKKKLFELAGRLGGLKAQVAEVMEDINIELERINAKVEDISKVEVSDDEVEKEKAKFDK